MKIYLNSALPETVTEYKRSYVFDGVTTNPRMVGKLGNVDYFEWLKAMRKAAGDIEFHTQVTSPIYEEILEEARMIRAATSEDTFIKIPANAVGIKAIRTLADKGYNINGTLVFSAVQGVNALRAGAKYIAPFYCYMLDNSLDADAVLRQLSNYVRVAGKGTVMVGGLRNTEQFGHVLDLGIAENAVTINTEIMDALDIPASEAMRLDFLADWEKGRGAGAKIVDIK